MALKTKKRTPKKKCAHHWELNEDSVWDAQDNHENYGGFFDEAEDDVELSTDEQVEFECSKCHLRISAHAVATLLDTIDVTVTFEFLPRKH